MADIKVDFDNKIIQCECGFLIHIALEHTFFFCHDCGQYHLHCCGCNTNIKIPWIIQDYIRTYQETLTWKTERMN